MSLMNAKLAFNNIDCLRSCVSLLSRQRVLDYIKYRHKCWGKLCVEVLIVFSRVWKHDQWWYKHYLLSQPLTIMKDKMVVACFSCPVLQNHLLLTVQFNILHRLSNWHLKSLTEAKYHLWRRARLHKKEVIGSSMCAVYVII